jgi:hypothetical protein
MTCFDSALFSSSTDDDDDGIDRGELIDQKIIPNVPERCVVLCSKEQEVESPLQRFLPYKKTKAKI